MFKPRLRLLFAVLVLCTLLVPPAPAQAAEPSDFRFGMNNILPDGYNLNEIPGRPWMKLAKEAGARSNRWEFRWEQIQPVAGPGVWTVPDWVVSENYKNGISLSGVLIATPEWASTTGRLGRSVPINLDQPPLLADGSPNPNNPWANFAYWTAKRYAGKVTAWEIWNEPNLENFWLGTPFQYYQLLRSGYIAIKAADPKAKVVMGGLSGAGLDFLKAVCDYIVADPTAAANNGFFDVFSWHGYTRPATIYEYTNSYRALLVAMGLPKEIWIGETGVPAWDDPAVVEGKPVPFGEGATQLEQAHFVIQSYAYALAAGATRINLYRASDVGEGRVPGRPDLAIPAWGTVRLNGTTRPEYEAYQLMVSLLANSWLHQVQRTDGYDRITFRTNTRTIHILFAVGSGGHKGLAPVVQSDSAVLVDVLGQTLPVQAVNKTFTVDLWGSANTLGSKPGDLIVSGPPVIIVEGKMPGLPETAGVAKLMPYSG